MIKKHIFFSLDKDETFWEFVVKYFMKTINIKSILPQLQLL